MAEVKLTGRHGLAAVRSIDAFRQSTEDSPLTTADRSLLESRQHFLKVWVRRRFTPTRPSRATRSVTMRFTWPVSLAAAAVRRSLSTGQAS